MDVGDRRSAKSSSWTAILAFTAGLVTASPASAGFSINNVEKDEGDSGDTTFTFEVELTTCPTSCSVNYTTNGVTATANVDFTVTNGTLVFGASPTPVTKNAFVKVKGDAVVELDETFLVALASASGASIDDGSGTGTIANDDSAVVTFTGDSEPEGQLLSNRLTLSAPVDVEVMVDYRTIDGTAREDLNDYEKVVSSKTWAAGNTVHKTVHVMSNEDPIVEADETVTLDITSLAASGRAVTAVDVALTIENDDQAVIDIDDLPAAEGDETATSS